MEGGGHGSGAGAGAGGAHCRLLEGGNATKWGGVKPYLYAILAIAICAGVLAWTIQRVVVPRFLLEANEETVADWRAGLSECRQETGSWPDLTDARQFGLLMYNVIGADERRIPGGYMHGRTGEFSGGAIYDVYGQPLKMEVKDDQVLVASAGANGVWGDADDVRSDQVKERYQPSTLAEARAAAEQRVAKKKK